MSMSQKNGTHHPGGRKKPSCTSSTVSTQVLDNIGVHRRRPAVIVPRDTTTLSKDDKPIKRGLLADEKASVTSSKPLVSCWVFNMPSGGKECKQITSAHHQKEKEVKEKPVKLSLSTTSRSIYDVAETRITIGKGIGLKRCMESILPQDYVGVCAESPTLEQIARMSKTRQKFFLTQDPRKKYCLRNPHPEAKKTETDNLNEITDMVRLGNNVAENSSISGSESYICDVVDLENPLQLDFQGLDYRFTYEQDEQRVENRRTYTQVCRHKERGHVKVEAAETIRKERHEERVNVPECFTVPDRKEPKPLLEIESPVRFGKLYRSGDKPYNKLRLAKEGERRRLRYKNLLLRKEAYAEEKEKQHQRTGKANDMYKGIVMADECFNETVKEVDDVIMQSFQQVNLPAEANVEVRIFPHSLRQVLAFKKQLKGQKRIDRDKAKVKSEFYSERLGKEKTYPDENIEISSDSSIISLRDSDGSTDDEDELNVGKTNSTFKLRGFHCRLGNTLRGKRHQREMLKGPKEKGCMTREEWVKQLIPKKQRVKLDSERGVETNMNPDDPALTLFHIDRFRPPRIKKSAVRNYIERRLGRHYDRVFRKNLKVARPRLPYAVKKFNLIRFLYGDPEHEYDVEQSPHEDADLLKMNIKSTAEYLLAKEQIKKYQRRVAKEKRLNLLGIPYIEIKKTRLENKCKGVETETDSDWVPDPDSDYDDGPEAVQEKIEMADAVRQPLAMRGNMPASHTREDTIRCNPKHPRDYAALRVPSAIFDETVKTTHVPHLYKMPANRINFANVGLQERPYTKRLKARYHHDHWDPTDNKTVNVQYQSKIAKPPTVVSDELEEERNLVGFKIANPACNDVIEMDLSLPGLNTKELLADFRRKKKYEHVVKDEHAVADKCKVHDVVLRSRPSKDFVDLDYPGRKEYLSFIQEIREALYAARKEEVVKDELAIDKNAYIKELEQDLQSIESCLSSISSSTCTNLTNDSGSFLLLEGKVKVPLDYIRRSIVPFEEYQRSRFHADPIDVGVEKDHPFQVLPYSGQKKDQQKMSTPHDTFFTFNTRLQNGLRLRLEVPVVNVTEHLLGCGQKKFPGQVATDIDETYKTQFKKLPRPTLFKVKTYAPLIKDALRLKFESLLIQGQIVRTKIYDRLNENYWQNVQKIKAMYEELFLKWEKKEYEAGMAVVYKVKQFYDASDAMKIEVQQLERQRMSLNMDIVFIEGTWIQRIITQNFHYLMGDQEWRVENDWIHRINPDEPELESYDISISKRSTANIREREKDDAWAIKQFYDEVYLKNKQPILTVFPDAITFLQGVDNLKRKTFVLLLEFHYTLHIHMEVENRLETFIQWCRNDLLDRGKFVERRCAKKYYMEDRAAALKEKAVAYVKRPLPRSYNDPVFVRYRAVIAEVWRHMVPKNQRGANELEQQPFQMVGMISLVVTDLLRKFQNVPVDLASSIEAKIRRRTAYRAKLSKQAYQVEKRIEREMKKVVKNLEPPFVRPPREGKLPRSYMEKKKIKRKVEEVPLTDHARFFFSAFHEEGEKIKSTEATDSVGIVETTQQETFVPFYFDHFLKKNGYTPNYNFRTMTEIRDGPEEQRITLHYLLPELRDKMDQWETTRKKTMELNIAKHPEMYENIQY